MRSRLLALNVLLTALAVILLLYIVWGLVQPAPAARPRPTQAGPPAGSAPPPTRGAQETPGGWSVIAARNLFSPNRSEGPVSPAPAAPGPQLPKPMLHGIVLREGARIAYLEDPVTKRVAAYRVGDVVAGATVKSISADHVVLTRPEGTVDVRLHDPAKPKPALPAAAPGTAPGPQAAPPLPGLIPPVPATTPFPPPPAPGVQPPTGEGSPEQPQVRPPLRRPLPPNLGRRVPPGFPPGQPNDTNRD
jgi:hypothetical protein